MGDRRLGARQRSDARAVGKVFAAKLDGRPVSRLIVTHYHPDHAGNAGWLTRRFGVPMLMSQSEFLQRNAQGDATARHRQGERRRDVPQERPVRRAVRQAHGRGQQLPARRPGISGPLPAPAGGRRSPHRRPRLESDHGLRACARARGLVLRFARRPHLGRHGTAAHLDQRQRALVPA